MSSSTQSLSRTRDYTVQYGAVRIEGTSKCLRKKGNYVRCSHKTANLLSRANGKTALPLAV